MEAMEWVVALVIVVAVVYIIMVLVSRKWDD